MALLIAWPFYYHEDVGQEVICKLTYHSLFAKKNSVKTLIRSNITLVAKPDIDKLYETIRSFHMTAGHLNDDGPKLVDPQVHKLIFIWFYQIYCQNSKIEFLF